jgi:broad specificity phosphatase PhoE
LELLGIGIDEKLPWHEHRLYGDEHVRCHASIEVTDKIREWDYGDYEGLTSATIQQQRNEKGMGLWDIWSEGCPGGECVSFH